MSPERPNLAIASSPDVGGFNPDSLTRIWVICRRRTPQKAGMRKSASRSAIHTMDPNGLLATAALRDRAPQQWRIASRWRWREQGAEVPKLRHAES